MKIMILTLTFAISSLFIGGLQAHAARTYGSAGCGLGNMALGKKEGWYQVFAATLNGVSGNQTFAITSGTSNCDEAQRQARVMMYLDANKFALSKDVARGEGETLAGLADVMGCEDSAEFKSTLRSHYQTIFPANMPETSDLSNAIQQTLKGNQAVARQCVASRS